MENRRIGNSDEWIWLDGLVIKRGTLPDLRCNGGIKVARIEKRLRGRVWGVWGLVGGWNSEAGALRAYAKECWRVMVMPIDD